MGVSYVCLPTLTHPLHDQDVMCTFNDIHYWGNVPRFRSLLSCLYCTPLTPHTAWDAVCATSCLVPLNLWDRLCLPYVHKGMVSENERLES